MARFATKRTKALSVAALTLAFSAATVATAEAGRRGSARNTDDYVVADSRFGNGTVVGPVRRTSVGRQVRTPGGNWLHCGRSCSETLRVNTVDFWQNEQGAGPKGAIDQEDGILGKWLHWRGQY